MSEESKKNGPIDLMREVVLTAESIGTNKTIEILQQERKLRRRDESKYRQVILKYAAKFFEVSVDDIINGRSKGDRTEALRCCYVITHETLKYNQKQIAQFFGGRDSSLVHKYIKEYNLMSRDSRIPAHISFFKKYDQAYEAVCAHFNINPKTVS